jgi:FMN phosphatase YigB (HAD superfamily)
MIKAITFDCWDTLLVDDKSTNKKIKEYFCLILKDHGFPATQEEMDELFSKEDQLFQNHIIKHKKTQNSRARTETILRLAGIQIPAFEVNKISDYSDQVALEFRPPVIPGIKDVLDVLAEIYKLGVICNTGWHSSPTNRYLNARWKS